MNTDFKGTHNAAFTQQNSSRAKQKVPEPACLANSKTYGSYSNSIVPGGLLVKS